MSRASTANSVSGSCVSNAARGSDPLQGNAVRRDLPRHLIVEGLIVVETKCVATLLPVHSAQVLTYMKLTNCPFGLLINFNVVKLMDGVKRLVLQSRVARSVSSAISAGPLSPLVPQPDRRLLIHHQRLDELMRRPRARDVDAHRQHTRGAALQLDDLL